MSEKRSSNSGGNPKTGGGSSTLPARLAHQESPEARRAQGGLVVGGLTVFAGLYLFSQGLFMKTSVTTAMGEVINFSLMDQANTYKMSGGFLVLIGLAYAAYSNHANSRK